MGQKLLKRAAGEFKIKIIMPMMITVMKFSLDKTMSSPLLHM